MTQASLFSPAQAEAAKRNGMELAASNRAAMLEDARKAARIIAASRADRRCTIDDVIGFLASSHLNWRLGNASGSVFKGGEFEFTGERIKSARASSHAREIKIWRLK